METIFYLISADTYIGTDPSIHINLLKEFAFVATGRLHRGCFEGFVVIQGILSNDPKGHCTNVVTPGIGFMGNFKSGKPHGVCWRELIGGSWIYGQVDDDGLFTGKTFFTLFVFLIFANWLVNDP